MTSLLKTEFQPLSCLSLPLKFVVGGGWWWVLRPILVISLGQDDQYFIKFKGLQGEALKNLTKGHLTKLKKTALLLEDGLPSDDEY